ncbi:MAG: hypothetical protein SGARI_006505, partial [Bacillariaceae sp.]
MPYSSTGGFINHASAANAKVVWATSQNDPSDFHRDEWLSQPPSTLLELERTGLLMHVVALRDIAEGEEITIDYGQEWSEAWEKHVQDWADEGNEAHITAAELNESEDDFRTIFEDSYPPGIATACHYRFGGTIDETLAENNPNNQVLEGFESRMLTEIELNAPSWKDHGGRVTMSGDHFRPCTIIARHGDKAGDSVLYTAKMENREHHLDWDKIPDDVQHFVRNVPSRAILFVDKAHTSHQQYRHAFRHEIGFPNADEMWPAAWRDLD